MDNNEAREILIDFHTNREIKYDTDPNHTYNELLTQAIDCAIQALGDGWVRVDDGLPDPSQRIIVQKHNGLVCEMWVNHDKQFMYNASNQTSQIIYWRHMPSPPKPKQP